MSSLLNLFLLLCCSLALAIGEEAVGVRFEGEPVRIYDDQPSFSVPLQGLERLRGEELVASLQAANEAAPLLQERDFRLITLQRLSPSGSNGRSAVSGGETNVLFFSLTDSGSRRWANADSSSAPVPLSLLSLSLRNASATNLLSPASSPAHIASVHRTPRLLSSPEAVLFQRGRDSPQVTLRGENLVGLRNVTLFFEFPLSLHADYEFASSFPLASNALTLRLLSPDKQWLARPGPLRVLGVDTGAGKRALLVELGFVEDFPHTQPAEERLFAFTGEGAPKPLFLPHNLRALSVEIAGAAGASMFPAQPSSCGAIVRTRVSLSKLKKQKEIFVLVGGMGESGLEGGRGGINGGGSVLDATGDHCALPHNLSSYANASSLSLSSLSPALLLAGGGGGSSDLRLVHNSVMTRLVVAAGGGGGLSPLLTDTEREKDSGRGGAGGGLNGRPGNVLASSASLLTDARAAGGAATQEETGRGGASKLPLCSEGEVGRYWKGGDSRDCRGGGGGGGFLSGGAGSCFGGGGGGSSGVLYTGTEDSSSSADSSFAVEMEEGKNCGHGYVKVRLEFSEFNSTAVLPPVPASVPAPAPIRAPVRPPVAAPVVAPIAPSVEEANKQPIADKQASTLSPVTAPAEEKDKDKDKGEHDLIYSHGSAMKEAPSNDLTVIIVSLFVVVLIVAGAWMLYRAITAYRASQKEPSAQRGTYELVSLADDPENAAFLGDNSSLGSDEDEWEL